MQFKLSSVTIACALALSALSVSAADSALSSDADDVHTLGKVTVEEVVEKNGETVLTSAELDMKPSATGTITDALRGQSFIQFDQNSRASSLGAEITPPQISIRGGRHYENNFTINGLSNTNLMNPGGWDATPGGNETPYSDAQGLMLSTDLLDSVTVLTENISAEYGDFTGGVVDAKIRDARTDRWHVKAWTRHTRDAWAQQHLNEAQANNQYPTGFDGVQNEFKRTNVGVTLDGPLADGKLGALISYEKAHSTTPVFTRFVNGNDKHDSKRDLDTFLIRLNTDQANDFYVAGTLIYSPYEAKHYERQAKDTRFSQEGGGWDFTLNTRANLTVGTWTNDFGFSRVETNRDTDNNTQYSWLYDDDGYANWISYKDRDGKFIADEGLQGDMDMTQDRYTLKSVMALNPLDTGIFRHNFRFGGEAMYTKVESDYQGFTVYSDAVAVAPNIVGSKVDGVISGEQAALSRKVQNPWARDLDYTEVSLFAEDMILVDRYTIRPGIRVSYDDITDDVNIAPRFFANMDVLNDGRFNVNIGANRYYGSQILSHALMSGRIFQTRVRKYENGELTDWGIPENGTEFNAPTYTDMGNLKTPYSDEIVLGGSADIADTTFKLIAVKRDHKDQIRAVESGRKGFTTELTNNGEASYEGITFAVEKSIDLGRYGRHSGEFGITWSDAKSNANEWQYSWERLNKSRWMTIDPNHVYLDGRKVSSDEVPANNFNSDWVITYNHNASFIDDRLRADLLVRWESGDKRFLQNTRKVSEGGKDVYYWDLTTIDQEHIFNADLMLAYDLVKTADTTVTLNVEALNLFDNKNEVNTSSFVSDDTYTMGRQFFLGITCEY